MTGRRIPLRLHLDSRRQVREHVNVAVRFGLLMPAACRFLFFACAFLAPAHAGTFRDSTFANVSSSRNVTIEDSVFLTARGWVLSKIPSVSRPTNSTSRTRSPDVASGGNNRFSFFWVDSARSAHLYDNVYKREIRVTKTGVDTSSASVLMCFIARPQVNYLHADRGQNSFLVSFIDHNQDTLKAFSDPPVSGLYRVGGAGNTSRASQCAWRGDTFLVAFQKDDSHLMMRRVYMAGNAVAQAARDDTIAVAQEIPPLPQHSMSNPSLAADSQGMFVVQWLCGTTGVTKTHKCVVYNANREKIDSAEFANPVDSLNMLNMYDDAPVISYARSTFGSVGWDPAGILFRSIACTNRITTDTVRIAQGPFVRYPTICTNGRYIAAMWMADSGNGTRIRIEGARDTIKQGYTPFSLPGDQVRFSDSWMASQKVPGKTVFSFPLNCTMDSSGNVAATWPIDSIVHAGIWANRGVKYDSGQLVSRPIRFMDNSNDSACMLPGSFVTGHQLYQPTNNDSVQASIRVGVDSLDQSAWSAWVPAADSLGLAGQTRGPYRFFQYRLSLFRGQDSLATPVVRRCTVRWNSQPSFFPLDSITINSKKTASAVFGTTVSCMSRSDTVSAYFSLRDADTTDTLYTRISGYAQTRDSLDSLFDRPNRSSRIQCLPFTKSDTTYTLVFSARDEKGWQAADKNISVLTHNSIPILHVYAVFDTNHAGHFDTVEIQSIRNFSIPQTDSVVFLYVASDTNDPAPPAYSMLNGVRTDSATQAEKKQVAFMGSLGRPMGDTLLFSFSDPETTITRSAYFRTNHFPRLIDVAADAKTVHGLDTVAVNIGRVVTFSVHALDSDVVYWDHLIYRFKSGSFDTTLDTSVLSFTPRPGDTTLFVKVTDSFGKADSFQLYLKSPWLAIDTVVNRAYSSAKRSLRDSSTLIVGSGAVESVEIPLVNTGNDTLLVTSLRFKGSGAGWLRVIVPGKTDSITYDSIPSGIIDTIVIPPAQTKGLTVRLSVSNLAGDGVVKDTIIIGTNDFSHSFDTLVVNLEYNELPRIVSVSFDFPNDKPYWLAKRSNAPGGGYTFPPHAKIAIRFTEPMDTLSGRNAIRAYSVFDSLLAGAAPPAIEFARSWKNNDSVLFLSARYTAASRYFSGFKPPDGFFIPGDSIRVFISSSLTDLAKTPHGPNNLDVHRSFAKTSAADTMIPLRVDSVKYTIVSVSPQNRDTGTSAATSVVLTFSGPPLPATVDTSRSHNRCLILRSAYFKNEQVDFSSITVNGSQVTFKPLKKFFYGDTVSCYYRGQWVRDSLGYSVDLNKNGIPMSMFDTTATEDDMRWAFVIKNIVHTAVSPPDNATNVSPKTFIQLSFSDSVSAASIDTARRGNRCMTVATSLTKGAPIAFDSVKAAGTAVTYYPALRFFYSDTVFCTYRGLSTIDTQHFSIDLSQKNYLSTRDKVQWRFSIKDIKVASVVPESASSANVIPVITMTFSDPVFSGTFDTDTSARNRSFTLTSQYMSDSALSFKEITVSGDSTQVVVRPKAVFFSNDSIHCSFRGFAKNHRYDTTINIPRDSSPVFGRYDWFFRTQNVGFYTFPNPYKPGIDPRHCGNPSKDPCGIWFTNLHTLKQGTNDLVVKILGMNGNPVYNSQTAGSAIHFKEGDPALKPQWKWDTRNQRGELVASGLYFYVVADIKGSPLTKGKLMIIR
jgi:hypothetical protein